ncbi:MULTISPECIES: 5-oxoprolinase subunit PxpA [Alteromonadaceae]|uniref:5-oxoprolinase subunit PxpA n=1 Tax=Alteromonadaceae TaxID=72275 RepID=UPI001C0A22F9|nr:MULTISPECIES: 5-oxoprolinase subunit PxpA [unclassified Aliiglaciecola]MBU2877225.1 5-oxoprolinase subunit PxpA [Aliiglaciecola lipolytica]MDO6712160.1 5-oxoprolinase subunit PxpA [Aliiglaciecola sp. 2_MG-2023]MDO6753240.1 5-oxoprolinase subunit PxpA [Aliiglaciecola sp. 1_MG-2023]
MKLNCDLGESYGAWRMPHDDLIMPYVDMANIACGFHSGDPQAIQSAIQSAKKHNVKIGAHPSYPDLQGFGRRSMALTETELIPLMHYQIAALEGMAKLQSKTVDYVKPHGALYNDMMASKGLFETVLKALSSYSERLILVIQAVSNWQSYQQLADQYKIELQYEAFADRRYADTGLLLSRAKPGAVLQLNDMFSQVRRMVERQEVVSATGQILPLKIDTLCVHGDSAGAAEAVKHIRELLS